MSSISLLLSESHVATLGTDGKALGLAEKFQYVLFVVYRNELNLRPLVGRR